jgi:parallel beta-helix repeat protein
MKVTCEDPFVRAKRVVHFALLFMFSTTTVYGALYYVDNSGSPICSDSYSGTESKPWCSIPKSINNLVPGDILYVKNGTYNKQNIYLTGKSGTDSQPITIKAFPGHAPIIDGNDMVDGGRNRFTNCNDFIFDGFIIRNMQQGVFIESSRNFILQNATIYNMGQEGVHVKDNSYNITLSNNIIHDTGKGTSNGEGFYIGTSSSGPADNTSNVMIRNNTVYNTTDEGVELKPGTSRCVVDNNVFYNTGSYAAIEVDQNEIPGVQLYNGNPSHIVKNNTIHDIPASGATAAIRAGTGCLVYNNVIYNIPAPKYGIVSDMLVSDSYPRRIYHNTVDLPSSRAIVNNGGTVDIRNNIGPATSNNIATSDSFYVNKGSADYHLVSADASINSGTDLSSFISPYLDKDGVSRPVGSVPDLGAYEYQSDLSIKKPNPPTDVHIQ